MDNVKKQVLFVAGYLLIAVIIVIVVANVMK